MTTLVPIDPDALLHGTVVRGSPLTVDALRQETDRVRSGCAAYLDACRGATSALSALRSSATDRLRWKTAAVLEPGARAVQESADGTRRALARFRDRVEQVHAEAGRLRDRVTAALETIRLRASELDDLAALLGVPWTPVWDRPVPTVVPEPASSFPPGGDREQTVRFLSRMHESDWRVAAADWNAQLETIAAAQARWHELGAERRDAEAALAAAIESTPVGVVARLGEEQGLSPEANAAALAAGEIRGRVAAAPSAPEVLSRLLTDGGSDPNGAEPPRVAAAWAGLSRAEQDLVIAAHPEQIGTLAGVPYEARDRANRRQLLLALFRSDDLSGRSARALVPIAELLQRDDGTNRLLVSLRLDGEVPLVAVGYGDLDRAGTIALGVPGMFSDAPRALPDWDVAARNLVAEAEVLSGAPGGVGAITYLAYDTPNLLTVLSTATARDAAPELAREIEAVGVTGDVDQHVAGRRRAVVFAHSYGTPVAALALRETREPVDAFVMLGSAGLDRSFSADEAPGVVRAADGRARVYSTIASSDRVAPLGGNLAARLLPDPSRAWSSDRAAAGARGFSSDGALDFGPVGGHAVVSSSATGYLDQGTSSLRAVAAIVLGQDKEIPAGVTVPSPREPNLYERSYRDVPLGPG